MDHGQQARIARFWILKSLVHIYPSGLDMNQLTTNLMSVGVGQTDAEAERHLTYLIEKGYVAKEEMGRGEMTRIVYRLRADGMDLLDGNIPEDPGICANG